MNKHSVHQLILDKLRIDLDIAERAAQTAYETATHEENIAENKYDTLGLEASYLAAGQAKRVEEIRQSLALCQNLTLRAYDENRGIEVGALLSPLGKSLLGKFEGDEVEILVAGTRQQFAVTEVL
jgi:hypothetical protein